MFYSIEHVYWIGISDVIVENQWIYSSTQNSLVVSNWKHGQPDGHSGENCVLMDGHSHGQWRDAHCHVPERFVCEMSLECVTLSLSLSAFSLSRSLSLIFDVNF